MRKGSVVGSKVKVQQIEFWLGEHVPPSENGYPGPTAWGERQDLLIKLYKGESTYPWYPIKEKSMEPVTRDDVEWPEVFGSKFRERF